MTGVLASLRFAVVAVVAVIAALAAHATDSMVLHGRFVPSDR